MNEQDLENHILCCKVNLIVSYYAHPLCDISSGAISMLISVEKFSIVMQKVNILMFSF